MDIIKSIILNPLEFIYWWAIRKPRRIFVTVLRMLSILNNQISLSLNLKLLFVPLYGDYTIVGRFVGLVFRIVNIVAGMCFFLMIFCISITLPVVWLFLPIIISLELDINIVLVLLSLFIWFYLERQKTPQLKVINNKKDILKSFTKETLKYSNYINTNLQSTIQTFVYNKNISKLLLRTELVNAELIKRFIGTIKKSKETLLQESFDLSKELNNKYVEIEHLFFVILKNIEGIDTLLSTYNSNLEVIKETIKWRVREREKLQEIYIWQEDYELPPAGGIGKGLTGRITPILDSFSEDYTKQVKLGYIKPIVGREKEIEELAKLLRSEKDNILLIGEAGSGKTSIIKGIAYEIMTGTPHQTLKNRRIVSINLGKLLAQATTPGGIATKITQAMDEIKGSKDIILFVDEMHELIKGDAASAALYNILEPYLNSPEIQFIGATSMENYRKHVEPNDAFARMFQLLEIKEANEKDTTEILKSVAKDLETKYGITITYPALKATYKLSEKLIHERVFPDKAIDILSRAVSEERNKLVTANDIAIQISKYTHIPVDRISENEAQKLLSIDTTMQKMVIGQNEAVKQISEAIKRARVGIRNENKPIASFLFIGTTGVGKTQTAKALAKSYFGSKDTMIRIDMSEYQQLDSLNRLIGDPSAKSRGILTEQVRSKPFSLILLDEIEKAHQNILLTFLQVLDDARLTDSAGITADFTNTIIISTSNVGTKEIQNVFDKGGDFEQMKNTAMKKIKEKFAPEFLNRFNDIIVFHPLSRETIEKITSLLLDNVKQMAKNKGINITFKPELIKELIKRGYSPEWGARPLEREISNSIENYLANKILKNEIKSGDTIEMGLEVYQ